jgi:hypothetical protein
LETAEKCANRLSRTCFGIQAPSKPSQRGELKKTQSLIWLRFFYVAILNIQQGFLLIIESKKIRKIAEI